LLLKLIFHFLYPTVAICQKGEKFPKITGFFNFFCGF